MKELTFEEVAALLPKRGPVTLPDYQAIIDRVKKLKVNAYLQVERAEYKGNRTPETFGAGLQSILRGVEPDLKVKVLRLPDNRGWLIQRLT